ncbi:MAG TPA: HDOD domain-containing protein [Burkholderiaceae bacterium]|nr:HDOD domain-containing protein [Burkholderiaceae bacterium]
MPDGSAATSATTPALEAVFSALREHGGLPSVGRMLSRLSQTLESDNDGVQSLSNLILQDMSLTQRLLRLANTIPYRAAVGREPVTTVTRAIMLLGFNQVRAAAMSLVLLDGLLGADGASRLRGDFHHALLAGSLAREQLAGFGLVESEEAGIVAMFRNVGRLLVAAFAPDVFAQIRSEANNDAAAEVPAARKLLGKSFEEVTDAVLREWSLPARIVAAVAPLPRRIDAPTSSAERIRMAAQFADEVATVLRLAGSDGERGVQQVLKRYGAALDLDRGRLEKIIESALVHTRELETACGLTPSMLKLPAASVTAEAVPAEAQLEAARTMPSNERDARGRPANGRELLLAGLAEVTETLARGADSGTDLNSVVRIVLESIYSGLGYARTALALRDPAAHVYRTRASFGQPAPRFSFSTKPAPDVFHGALAHATDLHIANVAAEKIAARLPEWFRRDFKGTASFLLMPLVVGGKAVGFLYADRPVVDDTGPAPEELNLLRTLRSQIVLAMRSR